MIEFVFIEQFYWQIKIPSLPGSHVLAMFPGCVGGENMLPPPGFCHLAYLDLTLFFSAQTLPLATNFKLHLLV